MSNIVKGIVILSMLAFVLGVIGALFSFQLFGISPEAFSRACNNLALIAIALAVCFKQ